MRAKSVFCRPKIEVYDADVVMSLGNASLVSVERPERYVETGGGMNNVSGGALAGRAYNGYVFRSSLPQAFLACVEYAVC